MGTYPQTDQVFLAGVVSWGIGRSFFTFVTWIQLKKKSAQPKILFFVMLINLQDVVGKENMGYTQK